MLDRMQRINELIRQEISRLLEENAEELGMVSVVSVETTRDLQNATVWIAPVTPTNEENLRSELTKRNYELHHKLRSRLELKRTPKLTFQIETNGDRASRVDELFEQIRSSNKGE